MKISYIHIENFRGIEKLTLSDVGNLTVIIGQNGSGKTSVLDAISILLSWLIARIRNPRGQGRKLNERDIAIEKSYCYLEIGLDNGVKWSLHKSKSHIRTQNSDKKTDLTQVNQLANQIAKGLTDKSDLTLIAAYGVNRMVKETPMRIRKT